MHIFVRRLISAPKRPFHNCTWCERHAGGIEPYPSFKLAYLMPITMESGPTNGTS